MSEAAPTRPGSRSVARKLALQALYRWQLNACPWQDLVGEFCPHDETRHPPYDTSGFILSENLPPRTPNRFAAAQAVLPHSRQNDSQTVGPVAAGDGPK